MEEFFYRFFKVRVVDFRGKYKSNYIKNLNF